ncbi:PI-PLC X domain-containing protein 1-like [Bombus affinis]|uniref:PI-PLC X domain-containing protein 1-like n=1 Tax=Bombus affinis TaxID=309941 RepID=UPI0021B7887B|nr:PI-PLC X domain-containing protein 1-like [Bombus affinis]XP_050587360.1 PI-PLC X domain-containing protein 1-like [Bombus affinis]XP_050587362.1 PI-PLC X domain-containing protein 1-like [Bombus affinis]XP_050587363.1 PI-PLC X domain-containing protein 1-like [Bombus affinis]XP_050587364.1 PI-PLC X domain-containing protein 1-like [Bombus affinis]XP_050587365.1 PI-PLC X domain-containing protein 1-like [Bombus affinis]
MAQYTTRISFVLILVIINETSFARICNSSGEHWQSRIGLLVSPIISRSKIREIEIYWNNVNIEPGDKISLFEENSSGDQREIYTVVPNSFSGVEKTGVLAEFIPSSNLSFAKRCTKYSVRWWADKEIKDTKCLGTQPTWMKERKDILGPLKMKQIFLPGTHDSASYNENDDRASIVSDFAVTQDLDILGQLIHGVRYLDIRVGRYRETNEIWWTNHGPLYRSVSLKTVIDQVKKFLDNTEEIVIIDIREFPIGFNNMSDHHALATYLEDEFRDYYLPNNYGWGTTLNEIWSSGKRLIIGYENMRIVNSHSSMWPYVLHQWGNVQSTEQLFRYLDKIETSDGDSATRPRSAMAEMTADLTYILFNGLTSLRDMAHKVNLNVTNWYSTVWQYSANIVAVDFLRSTDIVEIAIESNENRHLHCRY